MTKSEMEEYKEYVSARLSQLSPFMQSYALGDFSETIEIPEEEDEFSELLVGLTLMVDDIKEMIREKEDTITKLQQTEEALRQSEEKYRTILENIEDGYFEVDLAGNFTFFNDSLCRMLGYPEEELMGMNNREYMDDENAKKVFQAFNTVYRTGKPAELFGWEVIRKDDTRRSVEASVSMISGPKGDPAGFRGIVRDITERKQAEREIEERRRYLEGVLRAAPDAIVALDARHWIVEWNSGAERLFGYSREEAIGRDLDDLVTSSDILDEAIGFTQTVLGGDELSPVEVVRYRKDGSPVDVILAASPILVGDELIGTVAVYTDITERKRAEEELKRRNRELTTLYEATTAISSALSLDAVLQAVAEQMTQALDSSGCTLSLWHRDRNLVETLVDYNRHNPEETDPPGTTYDLNDYPATRRVLETGRPTVIRRDDLTADESELALMETQDMMVLLMLPLIAHDQVVGLVELVDDVEARQYTLEQLRLAESLAAQAAIAIENARLYEEIEQRRVYLEGVLGAAPDAIVTLDAYHRIVEWNPGAERLFGYSRDAVIGQNIDDLVTRPDVLEEAVGFTQTVTDGGEIPPVETVRYRKDGCPVDVIVAGSPILVGDKLIGVVAVYTDITERKRAEEALRASEERYRLMAENATDLISRHAPEGIYTYASPACRRLLGLEPDELVGHSVFEFVHPDDLKGVRESLPSLKELPESYTVSYRMGCQDGAYVWVESVNRVVRHPDTGWVEEIVSVTRDITERKRADEALRESEERYRSLFDRVPVGLYRSTPDGRFLDANPALVGMLGYPDMEALLAASAIDTYAATEDRKRWQALVEREGVVRDFEVQLRRRDGEVIWMRESTRAVRDADGRVVQYEGTLEDITERKQAEEALRVSEERFALAVQGSNDGIWDWDIQNNSLYWSPRLKELLGYADDELDVDFDTFESHLHPDDSEHTGAAIEAHLKDGGLYDVEQRLRTKSGEYRWYRARGQALWDEAGQPLRMVGSTSDITERKRAEEALAEERNLLQALMDNIPDTIYFKDPAAHFTRINKAQAQVLGVSDPKEAIGKTDFDFFDAELARDAYADEQEIVKSGRPLIGKVEKVRIAGQGIRWFSATKVPIVDKEERVTGLVGISRDITERVRAEEQLQRYAAELEQANEEVKQFAYIVSHDLRTPLVNLKGFSTELRFALETVDSAMDTALLHLDEKQRQDVTLALEKDVPEALGFIDSSVTHIDRFIQALLKLSRLGRRELHLEPVDMEALAQASLQTLSHQIEEWRGKVTVRPLPEVVADRTSMEQIVGNLLGNAVKYLDPERAAEIEITAERGEEETIFQIRDNGRGIAEEDMPKVFAPFRRVGWQDVPGEGMGLPYVQALVRRHGGRIWCESELGVGTTFSFTIPDHLAEGGVNHG